MLFYCDPEWSEGTCACACCRVLCVTCQMLGHWTFTVLEKQAHMHLCLPHSLSQLVDCAAGGGGCHAVSVDGLLVNSRLAVL